ncbi:MULTISPECIES: 50S ribosomal protein L25/general stress protein Ctc [Chelatococcus]|uniref:Large ribosomal subunit protein bL25 n=1 Tax=Chelatococcus caeni TaxID=1348468 RepID=A0A840BXJ9_9HYPH|nr:MULTISPECIES: 50S ribosomal protein L25/general stress protein Ctc [Chelatococcus]ALA16487.1 50S ribosomal protein L25 [Chelatococcus sp. CO-6]MBB4018075.1 large subunit ribosomal protein L25 [Chelatococcus caeni]
MSAVKQLKASARERVGKGAARAVRREGRVPAVIYGLGEAPQPIALDFNETKRLIFSGGFLTTLFEIDVDGSKTRAIPRDFQLDPVKDTPLHVDFLRVTRDATVNVEVPVHFLNQEASPGLKRGGTLNVVRHTVELVVPVDAIPDAIDIDLTGREIGDSIHISAVKLPAGASPVIQDRDFTIATLVAPSKLAAEAAEEAAAGEAEEK